MGFLLRTKIEAAGTRIWPANGHYMGLNLGVFLQIVAYLSMEFWAGESGDIAGPDLPMDGHTGRIFYDGENAGGDPALFFAEREAGGREAIIFENCRVVLFPESSARDAIIYENPQLLSRTFFRIFRSGSVLFCKSSAA